MKYVCYTELATKDGSPQWVIMSIQTAIKQWKEDHPDTPYLDSEAFHDFMEVHWASYCDPPSGLGLVDE